MTLIELVVAATLGLLIAGGVGAMFVQGGRSHSEDDRYLRMIENGRCAINVIASDLRMISFRGEMFDPGGISLALVAGEDCGLDLFDGATPVSINNPHASPALVQFDVASGTCASLTGTVSAGTSQLALKHTSGVSLTSGHDNNAVYVRSNAMTSGALSTVLVGALFMNQRGPASPFPGISDTRFAHCLDVSAQWSTARMELGAGAAKTLSAQNEWHASCSRKPLRLLREQPGIRLPTTPEGWLVAKID